jgi:hypothetical protein
MFSPFKFCSELSNSYHISDNVELATELTEFFDDEKNHFLWQINTHRQTTTHALRNTESIMLRKLALSERLKNTLEYNQVMTVEDSDILKKYSIFDKTVKVIELMLREQGVEHIEWGRVFFSKFFAESDIDEHTDEGKYFSYFDRFHFVISSPDECVFHIREEDIYLKTGGLYWVNNHVPHWLKNYGSSDRINLIFDARLS